MASSLKGGLLATYGSQLYVVGVGIAVTPLYLHALGPEAYGLVGFFAMLLAWFQLLDVGLSPTVVRETARYRGKAIDAGSLRATVRAIEIVFLAVALTSAAATVLLADLIAYCWLKPVAMAPAELREALYLMAGSIGLRFAAILYRAVLTGFERLTWLGGFNAGIATLRAFLVLPAMALFGATPWVFFIVQLLISLVELAWLVHQASRSLPALGRAVGFSLRPLRGVARFSAAVAFTGGLTVTLTQADRLILSGLLTLQDYAHFNLAVMAASAVLLAGSPLALALMPRISALTAARQREELLRLYVLSTRVMSLATLPLAFVLAAHAHTVMWAWTGLELAASSAAPVLALYALGNATVAHLALPYLLQFASGRLRMHVIGHVLLVATLIPGQVLLTMRYGAVGAGGFWLAVNLLYGCAWIPFALRGVAPDTLAGWYRGIAQSALACAAAVLLLWPLQASAVAGGRLAAAAYLLLVGGACSVAVVLTSRPLREAVLQRLRRSHAAEAA